MNKYVVEFVKNQESQCLQLTGSGPKTKQVETYTRSQQPQQIPQGREIQNEDTGNNKDLAADRGVGDVHRVFDFVSYQFDLK